MDTAKDDGPNPGADIESLMGADITVEHIANKLLDDVMEVTLEVIVLSIHRDIKAGVLLLEDIETEMEDRFRVHKTLGCDIFGYPISKKTPMCDCTCPECNRTISASRFAPHLEKCMGLGRTSSRVASRRIADSGKMESTQDFEVTDDANDKDWVMERKTNKKREKKVKSSSSSLSFSSGRVSKSRSSENLKRVMPPAGGGEAACTAIHSTIASMPSDTLMMSSTYSSSPSSSSSPLPADLSNMDSEKMKVFLSSSCGVISEHTGRMCTRSMRCPQHSDDQRLSVRERLLKDENDDEVDCTEELVVVLDSSGNSFDTNLAGDDGDEIC